MWKLWSLSALAFFCCVTESFAQPTDNMELIDRVVAVLGNEPILFSDIESKRVENALMGNQAIQLTNCEILEEMLLQKLYLNQAKLDSLEVSDEEIYAEIDGRMAYYIEQLGSIDAFEQYYSQTITEYKVELYEPIKENLLIDQMRKKVASATNVTPKDVEKFFNDIPKDSLPLIESEVQYSQIVILPKVKFEEKKRTKNFLDSIRTAIIDGKTSMSVEAARHSQDPGSKYKGGCYDLIERGTFVQEYEAAVFTTNEGMYSPVFESKFGFHFVYVDERRGEFYKSCHILMKPKITQTDLNKARVSLDSILTAISIDSLTFEKAAIKFSKDEASAKQGGKVIDQRSFSTKHPVSSLEPSIFFVLDELEPGEISEPMEYETPEGQKAWRVIRLDARSNAHKANLRDDYQMIKQYAESIERQMVMNDWVDKKIKETFLRIDEDYMGCEFGFKWHQQ